MERVGYAVAVRVVRLYDASRRPPDWMDLIQPGEVAAFPLLHDGEQPCDADGRPTGHGVAVCLLFESLLAAERFCEAQVQRHRAVRFDVFDHAGRSRPPLVTIVHPSHRAKLEGNAEIRRRNHWIVATLVATAAGLFWYEWYSDAAPIGLPTLLALNALVFAGRLLQLNAAYPRVTQKRGGTSSGTTPFVLHAFRS